ncbi:peptide ABC transporter ATPase [Streptomyces sp. PRh5]|uniref:dipeptide/oligopeptide/nickel ABC transporter permease/ATP-binding protein n=1 Tax=Streptomyces sp. PRh5 TaxID=1158056 RepID=UPI00044CD15E|nr:dipeptide/oligopeptide/nickel ABC transporter permease/ATP-binding protein [Streptomyces sp. PRh5]EXU63672.1 peptide ABC transporter ATPase [Streptomyces sp. PRh5]
MTSRVTPHVLRVLRTPVGACAAALVAAVLILAVLAPPLWSADANAVDTSQILQGASTQHWMGTDRLGRDIFFRVLVATRLSVQLAALATAIGVVAGLLLGTAPLLLGTRWGRPVTAVVNVAVAFPGLLLALFFAVIFGVGSTGAVLAIGLASAPGCARLTHALISGIAGRDFIAAARVAGVGRFRVVLRHVLPNIGEPLIVNATIMAGTSLLAFAGLSFLGLGVQAPDYDWGRMLGDGLSAIYVHPFAALAPGVAVVTAGLAFNLFGEALARAVGLDARTAAVSRGARTPLPAAPPSDKSPAVRSSSDTVLCVENLHISVPGPCGLVIPVRGVSFALRRGEAVGVVGESGSGKSLTAMAIAQLVEEPGSVSADRLAFMGEDLQRLSPRSLRRLLGTSLAMVFQDPMTSFNPAQRVGRQLAEVAEVHQGLDRAKALARAVDRLRAVRIPGPERRAGQYPHEFSGGMRQRAVIGMGLMGSPALIVADEPTTALDMTVQRQVLRLLAEVREADDVALLLISHDITVVEQNCDRVLVMYAGRIVEDLAAKDLRTQARHPYTQALLAAVPSMTMDRDQPLVSIPGSPFSPADVPGGCAFAPRCPLADEKCADAVPPPVDDGHGQLTACWHTDLTDRSDRPQTHRMQGVGETQ